jgi:hypothetical protein
VSCGNRHFRPRPPSLRLTLATGGLRSAASSCPPSRAGRRVAVDAAITALVAVALYLTLGWLWIADHLHGLLLLGAFSCSKELTGRVRGPPIITITVPTCRAAVSASSRRFGRVWPPTIAPRSCATCTKLNLHPPPA